MTQRRFRAWMLVHKWTSLISTLVLLLLCVTGLPLIFKEEIEAVINPQPAMPAVAPGTPSPSLDEIVRAALQAHPGDVPISIGFFKDKPAVQLQTAPNVRTPFPQSHVQAYDLRTGSPVPLKPQRTSAFTEFFRLLHTELFLGLPGALFLGVMALLLVAATISGIVVYAPYMRRLPFGTVRSERSKRLRWLDLHNLLGISTAVWVLAVGVTGAINSLHDPVAASVRTSIAEMTRRHHAAPAAGALVPVDRAIAAARQAMPSTTLASVFFPGAGFSTNHHYAVFMRGNAPLTARLFYVALIDAESGTLTDTPSMPWYATALLVSQPLHFGDYGGLPLKIIWALLDLAAIAVLITGTYLWLARVGVIRAVRTTAAS